MTYTLGARDETWDAGEAEKSYNLPDDADCYMYKDPNGDPKNKSSYKLPYVSKDGGKHAVWKAVTAIAAVCQGGRGGVDIPSDAMSEVKKKVASYYKEAASKYKDDSIQVPWERSAFTAHPDILKFEQRYGQLGGIEKRYVPLQGVETRDNGEGNYSVTGYASVFDSRSLDLGGFVEEIDPTAFDDVLETQPDVHLLWDHDTTRVLARTLNNTLHLKTTDIGLNYWGKVAPTSYAADLRILLDRGDISEASFAFEVDGDGQEWSLREVDGKEQVLRRISKVSALWDVTICAQGAYPAATSGVVRSYVRSFAGLEESIPSVEDLKNVPEEEAAEVVRASNKVKLAQSRARARAMSKGVKRDSAYMPQPYHQDADEDIQCPSCGLMNSNDAKFCDQCACSLVGQFIVEP